MMKKIFSFIICSAIIILSFTACGKYVTLQEVDVINFTPPQNNEEIAVINVKNYGDIKIKLFPDECPKGVENFKRLINEMQYYDNITFHRVIADFMIQTGDPTGSGSGGESIWNEGFEQELNSGLRHFSGAVSYATGSDRLNRSQFFIVTGTTQNDFKFLSDSKYYFPSNVVDMYGQYGGYPTLDGNYEVFGQVFEGLDICFRISQVQTDENDKPLEDIIIEKAEIVKYQE